MCIRDRYIHDTHTLDSSVTFDDIYYLYYRQLHFYCNSIINSVDDAKDIVSDVFVGFYGQFQQFNNVKQIKSYLYTSVRNAAINYIRHQKIVVAKTVDIEAAVKSNSFQEHFFDKMVFAEYMVLLTQEVEKLPEKQKNIFKMLYFENMTADEISKMLNISTEAVYNNKKRAVDKLKAIFKGRDLILFAVFLRDILN